MSPARARAVSAGILALALATAASIITARSWWPIAHYPMFSYVQTRAPSSMLELYWLHGAVETPLAKEAAHLSRDFDSTGLRHVLGDLQRRKRLDHVDRFLLVLLDFERARATRAGTPPPTGLRLYRVHRDYEGPTTARRRVARRDALAEVSR